MLADLSPTTLGEWLLCAFALLTALSCLVRIAQWAREYIGKPETESELAELKTYTHENVDALRDGLGEIHVRLAKIDARLQNGLASNIEWLKGQVEENSKVLARVQQDQARMAGLLEGQRHLSPPLSKVD